jgi:hypothetical protein
MPNMEQLIENLGDFRKSVRYDACEALRTEPSITPAARAALEKATRDPDPEIRERAAAALAVHVAPTSESESSSTDSSPVPVPVPVPVRSVFQSVQMPSSAPNAPEYIFALEKRIMYLEAEIGRLRQKFDEDLPRISMDIEASHKLPTSNVVSPQFFTRAFAIWGHVFVAQLTIGLGIYLIFLVLVSVGH